MNLDCNLDLFTYNQNRLQLLEVVSSTAFNKHWQITLESLWDQLD
jgi:hypothetical protein